MTIALGILASDGVVIAADSEVTYGDVKLEGGKLRGSIHASQDAARWCLLAGAGLGPYIDAFAQSLDAGVLRDTRLKDGDPRIVFEQALERFYARHVIPFAGYPPHERPDFSVVIAYSAVPGEHRLFESYYNTLIDLRHQRFTAIGAGSPTARLLLGRLLSDGRMLSVRDAVIAASYAVLQAKESVPGCGKHTDLRVFHGHAVARLTPLEQAELDALLRRYSAELEPAVFRVVTGEQAPERASGLISDLRVAIEQIVSKTRFQSMTSSTQTSDALEPRSAQPVRQGSTRGKRRRPPSRE